MVAEITLINGTEIVRDPGLARLRRTLPILAVIGAPFASMGGHYDPVTPLDPAQEWAALVAATRAASALQRGACAPLALVRLLPPTAARLGEALSAGDEDGFRAVHFICHGERDMLYLEDPSGAEDYVVAEHLVRLFQASRASVVVLEGCFSRRLAQMIVEETSVSAVLGTQRRVPPPNAAAFNTRFYAEISGGTDLREAFRIAVTALEQFPESGANRYELVTRDALREISLPLPPSDIRATRGLVVDGQPRQIGAPDAAGFVGRRPDLAALAQALADRASRPVVLHGIAGVGKSRLASVYAQRFGWLYPEGLLWHRCTAVTTAQDFRGRLARLLGRAPIVSDADLAADLKTRRVLIVADQFDAIARADARAECLALFATLLERGDSRVLITARSPKGLTERTLPAQTLTLDRLDPKSARTLALRRAVEHGIDALDVDTIDDYLERTLSIPWLILKGLEWIKALGMTRALQALADFRANESDPLSLYYRQQVQALGLAGDESLRLLRRVASLPDGFDERLAQFLARERAAEQIAALLHAGLLERAGDGLRLPEDVRAALQPESPPGTADLLRQGQLDRAIMEYLTRTWPETESLDAVALPAAIETRLNNARALLAFHLQRPTNTDPTTLSRLLIAAAPAARALGLNAEFATYARAVRDRLPEGADLARLQICTGTVLADAPETQKEAGWLLQVTGQISGLDSSLAAEARLAYARYLLANGQPEPALSLLTNAFQLLRAAPKPDLAKAVELMHLRGDVFIRVGRDADAIRMLHEALSGYARINRPRAAAAALHALAGLLVRHADAHTDMTARAEDLLRRALASADHAGDPGLAAQIRADLATLLAEPAGDLAPPEVLIAAAGLWSDALWDRLAQPDLAGLAETLCALAQVEARAGALEDAASAAGRAASLWARLGDMGGYARALALVGQFRIASGDAVAAQGALHSALELGAMHGASEALQRAAGLLVRVHQLRARRAPRATPEFQRATLESAQESRALLERLGLREHVAALDTVISAVQRL